MISERPSLTAFHKLPSLAIVTIYYGPQWPPPPLFYLPLWNVKVHVYYLKVKRFSSFTWQTCALGLPPPVLVEQTRTSSCWQLNWENSFEWGNQPASKQQLLARSRQACRQPLKPVDRGANRRLKSKQYNYTNTGAHTICTQIAIQSNSVLRQKHSVYLFGSHSPMSIAVL